MEENTEADTELVFNYQPPAILQVDEGDYVIFPRGLAEFADSQDALALAVDSDGQIHALRKGAGKLLRWVGICDEAYDRE
jgi:hypothetical protein